MASSLKVVTAHSPMITSAFSSSVSDSANPKRNDSAAGKSRAGVVSPVKVLQNILHKKASGRLTLLAQVDGIKTFWRLHVGVGQLHYASSAQGVEPRLRYLLHRYAPELLSHIPDRLQESEYEWLQSMWQAGNLPFNQLRFLLQQFSQDALIQVLSLPQAHCQFDRNIGLNSILMSAALKDLVSPVVKPIKRWQALKPVIASPFQRVSCKPGVDVQQFNAITENLGSAIEQVGEQGKPYHLLANNYCLYELAVHLNMDLLHLAELVFPLAKAGLIQLNPYDSSETRKAPIVACIDDSPTVQRTVKLILEPLGCQVEGIVKPLMALSSLGRNVPDLILLDINMPELDGYTLCRMLRQCSALKDVPIVMLTGRDALLDKVRAKLLGASQYVTKPFQPQDLVEVIHQHINVEMMA